MHYLERRYKKRRRHRSWETLKKLNLLKGKRFTTIKIFITHGHLDHAGGAFNLSKKFNIPIEGPHKEDEFLISALEEHGKMYGLSDSKNFLPDRWLDDGDQLELDGIHFDVYHCPGHTPGHVIFHNKEFNFNVGDAIHVQLKNGFSKRKPRRITNHKNQIPLGDDVIFTMDQITLTRA